MRTEGEVYNSGKAAEVKSIVAARRVDQSV